MGIAYVKNLKSRAEKDTNCRSVHAEANAIICASRDEMIGGSIFLCGVDAVTGEYILNSNSCSMCKRLIINAGLTTVYVRDTKDEYRKIPVQEWIDNDESLDGVMGY